MSTDPTGASMSSKWKIRLFWTLFVPLGLTVITISLLQTILDELDESFDKFENWAFDEQRKAAGLTHIGSGIWTSRDR
jgi:hypothetical protein